MHSGTGERLSIGTPFESRGGHDATVGRATGVGGFPTPSRRRVLAPWRWFVTDGVAAANRTSLTVSATATPRPVYRVPDGGPPRETPVVYYGIPVVRALIVVTMTLTLLKSTVRLVSLGIAGVQVVIALQILERAL